MVACGVVFAGLLTGLDWWDWLDRFDVVESSFSSEPAPEPDPEPDVCWAEPVPLAVPWLAALLLLVWVVRPSPTAAPSALTTLSPARPA